MSGIFEQLGFKKKTHVGISLSPNNFIELVCIDKGSRSISKYASGNIKYNNAIREIIDYDEFTEVLEGLFSDVGLNPEDCAVTINLPNVHFGITEMENDYEESAVLDNVQADVEELYVFKRNEPIISHAKFDSKSGRGKKTLVFSAIQAKVVVKLLEIFENLQCEVVRIDTSYSSLLKAIQFCDHFNRYVQKEERTAILLVTPNSCVTFYLEGTTICDIFEEPLAVKSFSTEEVYSTITKIADATISKNQPQTLLVISETDEVNAELLASRINFEGEKDYINKSVNANEEFISVSGYGSDIDQNMISYLTIEAVGAAAADYDDYPLEINFLPPDRIKANNVEVGGYEVDMTRLLATIVIVAIVLGGISGYVAQTILNNQTTNISDEASAKKRKVEVFKKRIKENENASGKNIFPVLKQIIDTNTNVLNVYNSLSLDIPETMYIKKLVTNSAGGIGIIGEAKTSEEITAFAKELKEKKPDLSLTKISINTENDAVPAKIKDGFTFEIKTENTDVYLYDEENSLQVVQQQIQNATPFKGSQAKKRNSGGSSRGTMAPPPPII